MSAGLNDYDRAVNETRAKFGSFDTRDRQMFNEGWNRCTPAPIEPEGQAVRLEPELARFVVSMMRALEMAEKDQEIVKVAKGLGDMIEEALSAHPPVAPVETQQPVAWSDGRDELVRAHKAAVSAYATPSPASERTSAVVLPELPKPSRYEWLGLDAPRPTAFWGSQEMHAYATAAVLADRAAPPADTQEPT